MQSVDQEALCQSAAHYSPAQQVPACISEIPHTMCHLFLLHPPVLTHLSCLLTYLSSTFNLSVFYLYFHLLFLFPLSNIFSFFSLLCIFTPPVHPSSLSTHPSFHITPLALSFIKAHSRKCESHI